MEGVSSTGHAILVDVVQNSVLVGTGTTVNGSTFPATFVVVSTQANAGQPAVQIYGKNGNLLWQVTSDGKVSLSTGVFSSTLAVNGQIQSITGGFVLPDGSVFTSTSSLVDTITSQSASGTKTFSSNAIFNGSATFNGTVAFATGSFSTPVTFLSTTIIMGPFNGWIMVSSNQFNGPATATMSLNGLLFPWETSVASISWRMEYECWSASITYPQVTFNTDNRAFYSYNAGSFNTTNGIASNGGTAQQCADLEAAGGSVSSRAIAGAMDFAVAYGSSTNVVRFGGYTDALYGYSGGTGRRSTYSGIYNGTAIMNQINFMFGKTPCSSGFSDHVGVPRCNIEVWRKGYQHQ